MKSLLIAIATALICSSTVLAQERAKQTEVKRVPAHTPEWTDLNSSDPGTTDSAIPELASIVVLCATKPESAEFKKAWQSWLSGNYKRGMNIDAVIANVLTRADRHRLQTGQKARNKKDSTKTSRLMHDTAKAVISNVR